MLAMLIMANQYATQQRKTLKGLLKKIEQISLFWNYAGIMPNLANIENPTEDQARSICAVVAAERLSLHFVPE